MATRRADIDSSCSSALDLRAPHLERRDPGPLDQIEDVVAVPANRMRQPYLPASGWLAVFAFRSAVMSPHRYLRTDVRV
jgi:hypothetical protein